MAKNNTKKGKISGREILWICFSILCFIWSIHATIVGNQDKFIIYGFTVLSFLMYLWRRKLRKSEQSSQKDQ